DRRRRHVSLRWISAQRRNSIRECGAMGKQIRQAVGSGEETDEKRKSGRRDGEVVSRSQILAHTVDAVAAADGRGVMPAEVISEPYARLPYGCVFVAESSLIESPGDTGEAEFVYALGIDVVLTGRDRQLWNRVAGVAKQIVGRTDELVPETEVERERLADPIVILGEPGIAGNAVVVVTEAAAPLA